MKKTLFTLAMMGALAACSQEKSTTEPVASAASSAPAASVAGGQPVIVAGMGTEQEKNDIEAVAKALKNGGMSDAGPKEAEWNQRLAAAKNNADVQAVLAEQLAVYEKTEAELKAMQPQSEAGKQMHAQLLSGMGGVRAILAEMKTLDFDKAEAQAKTQQLKPKMQQHAQEVMVGMQGFVDLMKANGLQAGSAQEAHFNQKMDELKEKINK